MLKFLCFLSLIVFGALYVSCLCAKPTDCDCPRGCEQCICDPDCEYSEACPCSGHRACGEGDCICGACCCKTPALKE